MSVEFKQISGLRVVVEEVIFMPNLSAPSERPFPFVYFLSIDNQSEIGVSILSRKWILRDDKGEVLVIEGQGVVGETPLILPGDRFSYNSYHAVAGDTVAGGSFFGRDQWGDGIRVRIPDFELKIPRSHE